MSKSSDDDKDGVPKFSIWDGDADRYLDAVDHFARYARRRHKNGTAEWIWGEACPIKPGMTQAEVNAACNAICSSLMKTNTRLSGFLWVDNAFCWRIPS